MAGFPLGGTYRGPDAVVTRALARLAAEWDGFAAHDDRYITDGEDVVVLARYTGRHHGTGKELDVQVAITTRCAAERSSASSSSSTPRSSARRCSDPSPDVVARQACRDAAASGRPP